MTGEDEFLEQVIRMRVGGIVMDPKTQVPVVVLRSVEDPRLYLPIFIGGLEAMAIATVLAEVKLPRPMTHDLMSGMLEHLECSVDRVTVTRLEAGTFYAEIRLIDQLDTELLIDARPSDSIALALRAGAPIYVAREVVAEAGAMADSDVEAEVSQPETDETQRPETAPVPPHLADDAEVRLEDLDPELFGKYKM